MKYFNLSFIFVILLTLRYSVAQTNTCNTLISDNGVMTAHDNAQIGIFGNIENNGTFNEVGETSEVGFYNTTNSLQINGTNPIEIANMVVDVPQNLLVNTNTEVKTGVLFLDGSIITPRSNPETSLDLINTDLTINVDDNKHVDGYTSYTGVAAYTFPIGDENRYRPLIIENGASVNTAKAAYFFENASNPNSFSIDLLTTDTAEGVFNVSPFEFWDLDGTSTTRVTLTWDIMSNLSQILNTNNTEELIVVGWNKTTQQWEDLGNFSITGNISQGSITSTLFNPNDYEALTFATNVNSEITNTDLIVYNGISDGNNDGINDFFAIKNIRQFPNNNLKIYNRWGIKVYEADGYDAEPLSSGLGEPTKAFTGKSEGRINIQEEELLPVGTYFYVLNYIVDERGGEKSQAGYLYINR